MSRRWRMSVYDLALGETVVRLPGPAHRYVHVLSGLVAARSDHGPQVARAGAGLFVAGDAELEGNAVAWVFEVDAADAPPYPREALSLVLSAPVGPPEGTSLIRADRIEAPPGAVTPRHGHRGPGIRRMLHGSVLGELGDHHQRIEAGQAWFETGHDPIVGRFGAVGHSAFVRVMLLPADLAGGLSSFVPCDRDGTDRSPRFVNEILGEITLDGQSSVV